MAAQESTTKSEAILQELKKRHRQKEVVDVEEAKVKVLIFHCGEGLYAFYGLDIREILTGVEVCWVPGLPEYLPGLINVRGDVESVVEISHFLGEKRRTDQGELIAIAVKGAFHTGIRIDSVQDVVDVPKSAIQATLTTLNGRAREIVVGQISHRGATIPLLDLAKLEALVTL